MRTGLALRLRQAAQRSSPHIWQTKQSRHLCLCLPVLQGSYTRPVNPRFRIHGTKPASSLPFAVYPGISPLLRIPRGGPSPSGDTHGSRPPACWRGCHECVCRDVSRRSDSWSLTYFSLIFEVNKVMSGLVPWLKQVCRTFPWYSWEQSRGFRPDTGYRSSG